MAKEVDLLTLLLLVDGQRSGPTDVIATGHWSMAKAVSELDTPCPLENKGIMVEPIP